MVDLVTLARTLHGHVGLLAAIALLHPALTLRPGPLRPGTKWSVVLAAALTTGSVGAGFALYGRYRLLDKPLLLEHATRAAGLFETKEHLAFYTWVLAGAGCALVFAASDPASRRLARFAFGAAAALALTVGAIGSFVASVPLPLP